MKKRLLTLITCVMLAFLVASAPVYSYASSLDDVINEQTGDEGDNSEQTQTASPSSTSTDKYIQDITNASSIDVDVRAAANPDVNASGTSNAQKAIKRVAGIILSILSWFLVSFLAVRVILDLIYIAIPFTRSFLANGYGGNAAAGGGGMGMQQPGMGAPGMMGGGFGGMGMNHMGMGMGMNRMGMGMSNMSTNQVGATPSMGRIQWISNAALNAVAAESMPGPDGKPQNALKYYAKDMTVLLVATPILVTLAITGVLTNLGFLLADLIARGITSFSNSL